MWAFYLIFSILMFGIYLFSSQRVHREDYPSKKIKRLTVVFTECHQARTVCLGELYLLTCSIFFRSSQESILWLGLQIICVFVRFCNACMRNFATKLLQFCWCTRNTILWVSLRSQSNSRRQGGHLLSGTRVNMKPIGWLSMKTICWLAF